MVVDVLSLVPHCYTYEDGEQVADVVRPALRAGKDIALSFRGVRGVPSSFVNAAFVSLLDEFPAMTVRRHVRVVNSSSQINTMIRDRMTAEAARLNELTPA